MKHLRRSAKFSILDRVRNDEIRNRIAAREAVVKRVEKRELKWFGHQLRMDDQRIPKRACQQVPPDRKERGYPRRSTNETMRKTMQERNLEEEEDALNRNRW